MASAKGKGREGGNLPPVSKEKDAEQVLKKEGKKNTKKAWTALVCFYGQKLPQASSASATRRCCCWRGWWSWWWWSCCCNHTEAAGAATTICLAKYFDVTDHRTMDEGGVHSAAARYPVVSPSYRNTASDERLPYAIGIGTSLHRKGTIDSCEKEQSPGRALPSPVCGKIAE